VIFPFNRVRIMVATKPIDFRKGHDGLAASVKDELHKDPLTGTVFVFRSRRVDRLNLRYGDGTGLVMAYQRLEEHTFTWHAIKDGVDEPMPCAVCSVVLGAGLATGSGSQGTVPFVGGIAAAR